MKSATEQEIIEYLEAYCGKLGKDQTGMVLHKLRLGQFLGVARPMGRMAYFPMVENCKTAEVLDGAGHYQQSAIESRFGYPHGPAKFHRNGVSK